MSPRTNAIIDCADSLYRAAAECCRQHQRYSRLVDKGVLPQELDFDFRYVFPRQGVKKDPAFGGTRGGGKGGSEQAGRGRAPGVRPPTVELLVGAMARGRGRGGGGEDVVVRCGGGAFPPQKGLDS